MDAQKTIPPPQNVFHSGEGGLQGQSEDGHTEFALVGLDHPGGVSLQNRAGWVGLDPQLGEGREELVPAFCHSFRGMGKDGDGVSAAGNPPQSHVPIWWEKALWQDEADIVAAVLRLSGLGIVPGDGIEDGIRPHQAVEPGPTFHFLHECGIFGAVGSGSPHLCDRAGRNGFQVKVHCSSPFGVERMHPIPTVPCIKMKCN